MRSISGWTAVLLVALCAPAWAQAPASSSFAGLEQRTGARAMAYWQWSPDAGARAPAQFGLRFDAPVRFAGVARSIPVVDLGFTRSRTTLRTLGAIAFDSSDTDIFGPDSLSTETLKKPVFWVGATAVVLLVSCATGNFPCKDDNNNGSGGSTSTPGGSRR